MFFHSALLFVASLTGALAAPTAFRKTVETRQVASVTAFSPTQLSSLAPFTQFARAAYCEPATIQDWSCGEACDALPGFTPTLTGGDGNALQFFFVGFWESQSTVIVSHQGTDPTQLMSVLTDLDLTKEALDPVLFPGLPAGIEVHDGFADEHALSADKILTEVKRLLAEKKASKVTVVGHSLGGALAELDSLFLKLNLPATVNVNAVVYGSPRVGNAAFVSFFDSKITDFTRVNNDHDVVPTVPGRFLGFSHPKGETHIISPGNAVSCPGNDDAVDDDCQIKTVPNVLFGNIIDHLGPYEGIFIGSIFCT